MLKPDSHGLRLPLIGMKKLSVCGLRFRSLILRLSGPFYSANANCLLSTPQRLSLSLLRSKLSLHRTVQKKRILLPVKMSMAGWGLTNIFSHCEQVNFNVGRPPLAEYNVRRQLPKDWVGLGWKPPPDSIEIWWGFRAIRPAALEVWS